MDKTKPSPLTDKKVATPTQTKEVDKKTDAQPRFVRGTIDPTVQKEQR